ncbi:ABC transporter substrate-binding protein [Paenibacillus allorhizosphaerae]|uniref:Extracellular solute-binding protein n=1 Tax=Paenibacillus allorhizosphaerae TaxID=2849866 RepID=A0ABN7TB56_9BACL|nr:extracellular solute-binding protein [Paenibacillus allorhizosphaerae]CAG7617936.1 hypothetical protein PAECIP111802_00467 [Paenibacillus allorhizosphaerae]
MRGNHRGSVPVLLLATALWLTACAGAGTSDVKNDSSGGTPKTTDEPVEMVFAQLTGNFSEESFMQLYGNKIKAKFPNITIKYIVLKNEQHLKELLSIKQPFDIVIGSIGTTPSYLLASELQTDISDQIKLQKYDLNRLEPTSVEIQRQMANGGIYGLPISTSSAALYYNKDIFDRFGIPYPKDGMKWDELYDLAKRMTRNEDGVQYKGLTMSFNHMMLMNQSGAISVDPKTNKANFTNETFKQAFENLARFYQIPGNGVPNNKYALAGQTDPFYKDKTAAMIMTTSGSGSSLFKDAVNWDVVQIPFLSDKPGVGPQSYPGYMYMTKLTKNREMAFKVLAYATSDEWQLDSIKTGNGPILKDPGIMKNFGVDVPALKGKNIQSLYPKKFADPTPKGKYQNIADVEMLNALNDVLSGTDVNTALKQAAERVNKKIEEQGS